MKKFLSDRLTSKFTRKRLESFLKKHATDQRILDLGSSRGPYKSLFPSAVTVDIDASVHPDIVADAHDLHMLRDAEFDVVLSTEMLEHLSNPFKGIEEIARVLKPGGKLILTTRFIFPLHETPHDYFRFTKYGLKSLLEPHFSHLTIEEEANAIETLAVLLQRIGFQTETLGFRWTKIFWHLLAKFVLLWRFLLTAEYGDIRGSKKERPMMTSGYYVVGRRR